jgi:hypothetical protein
MPFSKLQQKLRSIYNTNDNMVIIIYSNVDYN